MKTGIYRHDKGEFYYVLFIGEHTETGEILVTCIPLTGNSGRQGLRVRHRPLTGPEGFTTYANYDNLSVKRFEYVGEEMPK